MNTITLILMLSVFPYIFIFYFLNYAIISIGLILTLIFFSFTLLLSKMNAPLLAGINLILVSNIAVLVFTSLLGKETGIPILFIGFVSIPMIIFHHISHTIILFLCSLSIIGFFLINFTNFNLFPGSLFLLNEFYSQIIYITISLVTFFIVLSCLKVLLNSYENNEKQLEASLKEASERKIQLEKVSQQAAFTRLTMGISHEIRNPMASMLTRSEIVEQSPENVDAVLKFTKIIKTNIQRILNITETMLKYGNPASHNKEQVSIVSLITEILDLIENKIKKSKITSSTSFLATPLIYADPIRLHQAFLNIILNAIESMENNGGTLTIETKTENMRLILIISDTGTGMTEEEKDQIFDPFYTTKYKNTGLGMAIVLKCIDENDGLIQCESRKEKGTRFIISFPILS